MKKRILSLILAVTMLVAAVPSMLVSAGLGGYYEGGVGTNDVAYSVYSHNQSIAVDAKRDDVYLNSQKITEKYVYGNDTGFEVYASATKSGLYFYAEIEDHTVGYEYIKYNTESNKVGNHDKIQIYFTDATQQVNYIQLDYYANNVNGETYTQDPTLQTLTHVHTKNVTASSCQYATRILRDKSGSAYGWVAEIYIPWSAATTFSDNVADSSQAAPYACSIGIQANNDTWIEGGTRPAALRNYCFSNYTKYEWYNGGNDASDRKYVPLVYTTYDKNSRNISVTGELIDLDGQLDPAYLKSSKVVDTSKWSGGKIQIPFTAYAVATLNGLYMWAEVEDTTMNNIHDTNAEQGDSIQIYLDWTERYASHEITGKTVNDYRLNDANFYGGWYSFDYEGNIKSTNDISALQSMVKSAVVKYENPAWNGTDEKTQYVGYAIEAFIPWNDSMKNQIGAHSSEIHMGIGFAVSDDDTYNYGSTSESYSGEYRTSISFDTSYGIEYYNHYESLPDATFIFEDNCPTFGFNIADKVDSVKVDGINTSGEYDDATAIHIDKWGAGTADAGDIYRVAVTDDAVYILVEAVDSTPSTRASKVGSNYDYVDLGISFGGRFSTMVNLYRAASGVDYAINSNTDRWYNTGALTFSAGSTIVSTNTASGWTYELKIPLTDADKAKVKNGTFDLMLVAMMSDSYSSGRTYKFDQTRTDFYLGASEIYKFNHFHICENSGKNEFAGASIVLSESINVKYYADIAIEDIPSAKVKFTINGKTSWAGPEATDIEGRFAFTFKGLAPQCLGDKIKAELYIGDTVVAVKDDYSVLNNLNNTKENYPETQELVDALLNYGAAAQMYAGYKTGSLVNAGLAAPTYEAIVNSDRVVDEAEISGAYLSAAGVYFANTNKLYVKVKLDGAKLDDLTVSIGGVPLKLELYNENTNEYIAYSEEIKVTEYDKVYKFVLSDGRNYQSIKYSVNAYCAAKQDAANANTAALAKATYAYGMAAEKYMDSIEPPVDNFEKYRSNIAYGSGNNVMVTSSSGQAELATFRAVFPVEESGAFDYKLYFSNNIDSSSNGFTTYPDMPTASYKIHYAALRVTTDATGKTGLSEPSVLTFDGQGTRDVMPGEMFWSDEINVYVPEGSYLVYEWTVEYTKIPATIVAKTYYTYKANTTADNFPASPSTVSAMPMPDLIGCTRGGIRLTFIGDSITMGTGSGYYENKFWVKQLSDKLGTEYCVWNLGNDSGRANDVVRGTSWKEKLVHTDILSICMGVNDIGSVFSGTSGGVQASAADIIDSISQIATMAEDAGAEIIIFSVPPFNFTGDKLTKWNTVNAGLKTLAAERGYKFFDFAAVLGDPDDPSKYIYGDHPNAEGCTAVADVFMAQGILDPDPFGNNFKIYQSNSITPTASNYALKSDGGVVTKTFRGIFKIQEFGELEYKFHFSNNVNSTFSNGSYSYRDMPTASYKVLAASIGTTTVADGTGAVNGKKTLTFNNGSATRTVAGGEEYWSDAITFNVPEGSWLVFEWTVQYTVIAATNSEGYSSAFLDCTSGTPKATDAAPMPILVGAKRDNSLRIAFIGDSITMGIVSKAPKSYAGWAAKITEGLGTGVSAWNLGLGYARADDAVHSEAWIDKAKQNDVVVICFGVNDINSGPYQYSGQRTAAQIRDDIKAIAKEISDAGAEVIIFSTPPYTYGNSDKVAVWQELIGLLEDLAEDEDYKFFDFASYLWKEDDHTQPAYDGHPNAEGCAKVAEAFLASGLIEIPEE